MSVQLAPIPVFQGVGFGGLPLPGGKLFTFEAGTSTPQATYTDSTQLTQNTNPTILNANGQANVWLVVGLTYKIILQDQFGNQIWSVDNVPGGISLNLTQQALGQIIYPTLAGEIGVTNNIYPYGCPRRHGAVGDGNINDTNAVQNTINSGAVTNIYIGWGGDSYAVTNIIWPALGGPSIVRFNGSSLIGIASNPTDCISHIKTNFATFYDYEVIGGGNGGVIPNDNYTCGTWWFNGVTSGAPVGASQFNTFYGMLHLNLRRGLVYGGLPGLAPTTLVNSENKIYGFQTDGVSNPIYVNSDTGFLHTYGSVYFRDAGSWTTPTLPFTARAIEAVVGALFVNGGEIIASNSTVGMAADLIGTTISDVYFELSAPLNITGDGNRFTNCWGQVLNQGVTMFKINASATGVMETTGCQWFRGAGNGATDRTPLVDGSSAPTFEFILNDCRTDEWGFVMANANVKLIQGCVATYNNHRLHITAADPNIYRLNSKPRVSIIPDLTLDHLGYTTTGWTLAIGFGGGTTLANNTNAGPTGYLASQLDLHATGVSSALTGDPTSLATLKSTAQRCTPGEAFWLSSWINQGTSGGLAGGQTQLIASFYNLTGGLVSTAIAADVTSIGTNTWTFAEGPAMVPATAAYVVFGVTGTTTDALITDFRIQRAS